MAERGEDMKTGAAKTEKELRKTIDDVFNRLVNRIKTELSEKIGSIIVTGSYARGEYSIQSPDINLYIFSKPGKNVELLIPISEIFHELVSEFKPKLVVRAHISPWRFGFYIPEKGKITLGVTLNIFDLAEKDNHFGIPENVLRGWAAAYKVVYGPDVLKEVKVDTGKTQRIIQGAMQLLSLVKMQLVRVPQTYDWRKCPEYLFDESYEYAKTILYHGLTLKATDEEMRNKLDLKIIADKPLLIGFYKERYGEDAGKLAEKIIDARTHYLEWKDVKEKAIEMYNAAWKMLSIVMRGAKQ